MYGRYTTPGGRGNNPPSRGEGRAGAEEDEGRVRSYGPSDADLAESRERRDDHVRPGMTPEERRAREAVFNNIRARRARERISEAEADGMPIITVRKLDLHVSDNAFKHHTNRYYVTHGPQATAVLRRGQEVKVTLTFDRPYQKDKDELFFILKAGNIKEADSRDKFRHRFQLEENRLEPYTVGDECHARLLASHQNQMTVALYLSGRLVVGEWDIKVRTRLASDKKTMLEYDYPKSAFVLFNPWSPADLVYYTGPVMDLEEYVLNDKGMVFQGSYIYPSRRKWTYGQFEKDILEICMSLLRKAFDFQLTGDMADPVLVSRALSRIVNSQDDQGVLTGNWSGRYEGGTHPSQWKSSRVILRQYYNSMAVHGTPKPVKFGQCWVFSHVLTAVCRCLGLPCRSVTNFSSAHDTDASCTIDRYVDDEGNLIKGMGSDSIWNYHVWNEVWFLRPDLSKSGDYDGWHVIDATPQEISGGLHQCGPTPVEAVKRGEIKVGYDTNFVFGEVNADVVDWAFTQNGDTRVSSIKEKHVGKSISTLMAGTKDRREDITHTYKYPEGSPQEREAVERAIRLSGSEARKIYQQSNKLKVQIDEDSGATLGKQVVMTGRVRNVSQGDLDVLVTFLARSTKYFDGRQDSKVLAKNKPVKIYLKAGREETFSLTVPVKSYIDYCDDQLSMVGYMCARDVSEDMPYTDRQVFVLSVPEIGVQGPKSAKSGERITLTVTFHNPLPIPLTKGKLTLHSPLDIFPGDNNPWAASRFGIPSLEFREVKPGGTSIIHVSLVGEVPADDEPTEKDATFLFQCHEIEAFFQGDYSVLIKPVPSP